MNQESSLLSTCKDVNSLEGVDLRQPISEQPGQDFVVESQSLEVDTADFVRGGPSHQISSLQQMASDCLVFVPAFC